MKKNTLLSAVVSISAMFALTACPEEEDNNANNTNNTNNTTGSNNATFGAVTVADQTADPANTVVVATVASVGPGFIVIHADDNGAPGEVLGNTAVNDGSNSDVSVTLSRDTVPGEVLYAMLHIDAGTVGTYEFPGPDGPATDANGDVITPRFTTGYDFRTDAWDDYTQVDRIGMPAVSTVLAGTLTDADPTATKEAYNAGTPTDDLASAFAGIAVANLAALHGALRDDLTGTTVCATFDDTDPANPIVDPSACLSQEVATGVTVANIVIPDLIVVDPANSSFPNGRKLADQVIDITLSVILLDIAQTGLVIDVNPDTNDKDFSETFPYLAAPH